MTGIHIRGLGLVSSYGLGVGRAVAGMRAGKTGITPLTQFTLPFNDPVQVNEFDHSPFPPGAEGIAAAIKTAVREALSEACLEPDALRDAALVLGTSSFLFAGEAQYRHILASGGESALPALDPPGSVALRVAGEFGIQGPVLTLSTACSSSANALLVASALLRRGEARYALVIGVEGLSVGALSGFHALMLLDAHGCRPFDAQRRGMQLGEGIGAVILEANGSGEQLLGGANLCDTHHMTSATPDGSAMRAVMAMALADAGLRPEDVALIKAHGTGSLDNDTAEAAAMHGLFGDSLPPFTAIKRYVGHTLGACGAIELAAFLGCLRAGFVPATAGFTQADPALRVTPLTQSQTAPSGPVMLNFFGFGGNYASLLLTHA